MEQNEYYYPCAVIKLMRKNSNTASSINQEEDSSIKTFQN